MTEPAYFMVNIREEMAPFFQPDSVPADELPRCVILVGGPAVGKTTVRKNSYGTGYVVVDAVPVFLSLCRGRVLPFPDGLEEPMELLGRLIAQQALRERRNIVTELIGDDAERLNFLIDALLALDYRVDMVLVHCPPEQAVRQNLDRDDDCISAFYAQRYQYQWLLDAATELGGDRREQPSGKP